MRTPTGRTTWRWLPQWPRPADGWTSPSAARTAGMSTSSGPQPASSRSGATWPRTSTTTASFRTTGSPISGLEEGRDFPSLGQSNLGTKPLASEPLGNRRPFVLISCSRMVPLKRVERIAEALERVRRSVTWIHIGDGPSRSAVERVVARLPESIRVELTGSLSNAEVLRHVSTASALAVREPERVRGYPSGHHGGNVRRGPRHRDHRWRRLRDRVASEERATTGARPDDRQTSVLPSRCSLTCPRRSTTHYARAAWSTWSLRFNAEVNYPRFVADVFGCGGEARWRQDVSHRSRSSFRTSGHGRNGSTLLRDSSSQLRDRLPGVHGL